MHYMSRSGYKTDARLFTPYPRMLIMADGESLCDDCARCEARSILGAIAAQDRDTTDYYVDPQWLPIMFAVHFEGTPEQCAHCGALVESAYGYPKDWPDDDD